MNKSKLMKLLERSGLKRAICMGLACILAVGGVLVGNAEVYRADVAYYNESWQTIANNPGYIDNVDTVLMYHSPEQVYRWGVTTYSAPSGYGVVKLTSTNTKLTILDGGNKLTMPQTRDFEVSQEKTGSNAYAVFRITMDYDSYTTIFAGYIKILG